MVRVPVKAWTNWTKGPSKKIINQGHHRPVAQMDKIQKKSVDKMDKAKKGVTKMDKMAKPTNERPLKNFFLYTQFKSLALQELSDAWYLPHAVDI